MKLNIKSIVYSAIFFVCVAIVLEACNHKQDETFTNETSINLKWNKAYQLETKEKVETGFLWSLSFLGANLPKSSFDNAISWNDNVLKVNFDVLGFNNHALAYLLKLINIFKQSEEYKRRGAIDLGRFITLTLNSSNHYYKITGIANSLNNFIKPKVFDNKQFVSTNSTISNHDRIIFLPDSNNSDFRKDAYVSHECNGKLQNGDSTINSFEVAELMENGQFRFAIYDTLGNLLTAANGAAGKPSKCLWCHEINIQTLHSEQTDLAGYYSAQQFKYIVLRNTTILTNYRNTLVSDIDYTKKQDHTFAELLYISFMEPSAERLALEWNISIDEVNKKLAGLPTHIHNEFGYLGQLYFRDEVDKYAPFLSVKPPSSAREKSLYEPNLIN